VIARLFALLQGRAMLVAGVAGVTALLGVGGWLWVLYDRIDNMQDKLDIANRETAQKELALQELELDKNRLREALDRQSEAVQELAAEANTARKTAEAQAKLIADMKTPPAGDGAEAMQDWWDQNVVR